MRQGGGHDVNIKNDYINRVDVNTRCANFLFTSTLGNDMQTDNFICIQIIRKTTISNPDPDSIGSEGLRI
jgi:hypothetical protein